MTFKEKLIRTLNPKTEIMHYKANKISASLVLLAIVLNALMFLHIYGIASCVSDLLLGIDLIINIVFMLFAFLCSENQKKYDIKAGFISIGLGIIELARIFLIPFKYHNQYVSETNALYQEYLDSIAGATGEVAPFVNLAKGLPTGDFTYVVILMVVASVLLIGAGIICILKTNRLRKYLKENHD